VRRLHTILAKTARLIPASDCDGRRYPLKCISGPGFKHDADACKRLTCSGEAATFYRFLRSPDSFDTATGSSIRACTLFSGRSQSEFTFRRIAGLLQIQSYR
jgi:hypothetical protein